MCPDIQDRVLSLYDSIYHKNVQPKAMETFERVLKFVNGAVPFGLTHNAGTKGDGELETDVDAHDAGDNRKVASLFTFYIKYS